MNRIIACIDAGLLLAGVMVASGIAEVVDAGHPYIACFLAAIAYMVFYAAMKKPE
jgi:precorrin-6x reductase